MVDCALDTGRAAWAEKCRIACAAIEVDMVTDVLLVDISLLEKTVGVFQCSS
jgi:hypothetical protein